jgi:uncharacterized membrane protein
VTSPDVRAIRTAIGVFAVVLGIGLLVWAGWLYHLATVADTTDETPAFYLVVGSLVLDIGLVALFIGVRYFRRGRLRN